MQHVTTVAVTSYLAILDVHAKKLLPVFDVRPHLCIDRLKNLMSLGTGSTSCVSAFLCTLSNGSLRDGSMCSLPAIIAMLPLSLPLYLPMLWTLRLQFCAANVTSSVNLVGRLCHPSSHRSSEFSEHHALIDQPVSGCRTCGLHKCCFSRSTVLSWQWAVHASVERP